MTHADVMDMGLHLFACGAVAFLAALYTATSILLWTGNWLLFCGATCAWLAVYLQWRESSHTQGSSSPC